LNINLTLAENGMFLPLTQLFVYDGSFKNGWLVIVHRIFDCELLQLITMRGNYAVNAVETARLGKYYGKSRGIIDVSMAVRDGEIFGFIGPNGAGKTTTIRLLLGLIKPSSGEAKIFGRRVPLSGGKLYRRVGYVPAEISYYPEMTGRDLLEYAAGFYAVSNFQWVEELVDRLQLDPDKKVRTYSHGNLKKVGIIQALLHKPQLLILDEPGSGLDPLIRLEMFKIIEEMNQKGVTIFFSTHVLEEVERICHRVAMIKEGSLIHVGPVDQLPGRDIRLIILKFAGRKPSTVAMEKLGEVEELPSRPGYYQVLSHLPVNELVNYLSRFNLDYLRITDPSLEEIFFDLYEPSTGGGNNHYA